MIQNNKKIIACALLAMLLPEQVSSIDKTTLVGGLAITAAAVGAGYYLVQQQVKGVAAYEKAIIIPNNDVAKDLKSFKDFTLDENGTAAFFKSLHPLANRPIEQCFPETVIAKDKATIREHSTFGLWLGSCFNTQLQNHRQKLDTDRSIVQSVENFTNANQSIIDNAIRKHNEAQKQQVEREAAAKAQQELTDQALAIRLGQEEIYNKATGRTPAEEL